ncbi:MAG TPA: hypothetical protein PK104_00485 [Spirochaetota bacterium]|jgi:hypothetical protein|nr:hypothetical protein [Spirochaetota bacterium]
MKKNVISVMILSGLIFLFSGCTHPQIITAQYVDKPVIVGPYWKVGGKLENYEELKKNKELRKFNSEVERTITTSTQQNGSYQTTNTQYYSVHADNISKDILMQNPSDNELILIKRCFLGSYLMLAPGGSIITSFGGVEGVIAPKP